MLCVIYIYNKYAWVNPLKGKKDETVVNAFQSILNNSKGKPTKYGYIKEVHFTIDQRNHG